ncbi:hypothetical protein K440DRAFT_584688, partial [Wilcoxina mikolae CBS 423.85]
MPPLIDSHIHLFTTADHQNLSWMTPSSPLRSSHTPTEYALSTTSAPVRGYIFVETDRSYPLPLTVSPTTLKHPLQEITYALSLYTSSSSSSSSPPMVGMIPFAPVPLGSSGMQEWWDLVLELGPRETIDRMIRGVRYLVQDKPRGTMTEEGFVDGLRWVLQRGWVFELGVDVRSGGVWQLEKAVEVMKTLGEGGGGGWVVIGHMAKPDLKAPWERSREWRGCMQQLAGYKNVAVKMSGVFSEIDGEVVKPDVESIVQKVMPWVESVLEIFGAKRVIWGSDWPVCNIGYGKMVGREMQDGAWEAWRAVSERLLELLVEKGCITADEAAD